MWWRKTSIEVHDYGSDFKRTTSMFGSKEEGTHRVIKISSDNLERDLPHITKVLPNLSPAPKPMSEKLIEPKTINLLPEGKPNKKWW